MSDQENKNHKPPAVLTVGDGFSGYEDRVEGEDRQQGGSVIKGMLVKFTNDATWIDTNDDELPADFEPVAIDVLRVVSKFVHQQLAEPPRILAPGEKFPDIEMMNEATPKSEWSEGPDGKMRGPYQKQHLLYMLNLEDMSRYTFPTGTVGGSIAIRELVDKTNWMRKLRGPNMYPRIALRDTHMRTKFGGRRRPHFEIRSWVQLGDDGAKALPTPTPASLPPIPGIKEVPEPTLAEHMQDSMPDFNDPLPEMVGGTSMPPPKPVAPAPHPMASKPHTTTKKGVTKFARR